MKNKGLWIVSEKGAPSLNWEISVLRETNKHGIRSYGWFDEDKILVWSQGGPCRHVCHEYIAEDIRLIAKGLADRLNSEELK